MHLPWLDCLPSCQRYESITIEMRASDSQTVPYYDSKARRSGTVVDVQKRETRGNKAHVGELLLMPLGQIHSQGIGFTVQGTDRQKLARLDEDNETRPPPEIGKAVSDVRIFPVSQKNKI